MQNTIRFKDSKRPDKYHADVEPLPFAGKLHPVDIKAVWPRAVVPNACASGLAKDISNAAQHMSQPVSRRAIHRRSLTPMRSGAIQTPVSARQKQVSRK